MAPTGGEEDESARDGDSTASKWAVPARAFSGDGSLPFFTNMAGILGGWDVLVLSDSYTNSGNWDRPAPSHPVLGTKHSSSLINQDEWMDAYI